MVAESHLDSLSKPSKTFVMLDFGLYKWEMIWWIQKGFFFFNFFRKYSNMWSMWSSHSSSAKAVKVFFSLSNNLFFYLAFISFLSVVTVHQDPYPTLLYTSFTLFFLWFCISYRISSMIFPPLEFVKWKSEIVHFSQSKSTFENNKSREQILSFWCD